MDKYIEIAKMLLFIIVSGYIHLFIMFSVVLGAFEVIDIYKYKKKEEK